MDTVHIQFDNDAANVATYVSEEPGPDKQLVFTYNLWGNKLELGNGLTLNDIKGKAVEAQRIWAATPPGPQFSAEPPGSLVASIRIWNLASGVSLRKALSQVITEVKDTHQSRKSSAHDAYCNR